MGEAFDDIAYAVADGVATIRICRESKRNALARRHFDRLATLVRAADEDQDVRVIVLTGDGERAFCAGADLSAGEGFVTGLAKDRTTGLGDYLRQACTVAKPIVGRINGHCYAGGIGLLASCDVAVASDDVRFALPEIGLGIFPFVVLAGLEERIAHGHALQLALSGAAISAGRALEIGLVSQIVPRPQLDTAVDGLAAGLARHSPVAMAFGLRHARYADIDQYISRITKAEALGRELALSRVKTHSG